MLTIAANKGLRKLRDEVEKRFLTYEQASIYVRIFAQQLFTDINGWIVNILNTQQDLVLENKNIR